MNSRAPDTSAGTGTNAIYLITGPMAAGKTTVAHLLAERFERGVHLEGDVFRRSIVRGRVEITPALTPDALEQLRLRYRLAAAAADAYHEAGFTVALEDVVAGELLGEYRTLIRGRPCHVVVLLPSPEVLAAREAGRPHEGYKHWPLDALYQGFVASTPRVGLWLDTSEQTPEETVDEILARTQTGNRAVVVRAYDEEWPALFERLAVPLREELRDLAVAVEHVGSTAVPGLPAKPVIDIDVVVASPEQVPAAIERLRSIGYVYQGDKGIAGREAFMWPANAPAHHLYVVVEGSRPHLDHVRFRDYLREHPRVAREYGALKRALAREHRDERERYTAAKEEFVSRVLGAASGLGGGATDDHLRAVARVYGPETWDVYDRLDRSLEPRGPELMLALAAERLTPQSALLDVGCRDASHLIDLVGTTGASGVGIDPLPRFVERARRAVADAGLEDRIRIREGTMQDLPMPDGSLDLVWCRDVVELVEPLEAALAEVARVLRPGGELVLYTVFATDRLEPKEAALLAQSLAVVPANLAEERVEAAFGRAGFEIALKEPIGTEWREHAEERAQPVSRDLLRLARLRRQRDRIVAAAGEDIYGHLEANLHWLVYQFLGKLLPTLYVLRKTP